VWQLDGRPVLVFQRHVFYNVDAKAEELLQRGLALVENSADRIESMSDNLARCGRALEKAP